MNDDIVILVAEDDKGHFVLTKHCLRRGGISNEIVWLEDGQQTLDFLFNPDIYPKRTDTDKKYVLLLDIRMPKIDGLKVLEKIKTDPELKDMPVIIITTSDSPRNLEICQKFGCEGYVIKPLDQSLATTVEHACSAL